MIIDSYRFAGGGVTLTLSINGSPDVSSGNAGNFTATLSAPRLIDTVLTISNGGISQAEIVTPQTILAEDTSIIIFVSNTGGYDGPVTVSITTDAGVTVLNSVIFNFSSE